MDEEFLHCGSKGLLRARRNTSKIIVSEDALGQNFGLALWIRW